jgi:NAD(P)-dependent dehydrogenase (short-subunit alcohol dehydrogenase family)
LTQPKSILITGGAGFIGSHTCLVLLEAGYRLIVLDNFSNGSPESLRRVQELVGAEAASRLVVVKGDIRSADDLNRAFQSAVGPMGGDVQTTGPVEAVIHFAGLKAVGESIADPLAYWDVNVAGSLQLLAAMRAHGCCTIVFAEPDVLTIIYQIHNSSRTEVPVALRWFSEPHGIPRQSEAIEGGWEMTFDQKVIHPYQAFVRLAADPGTLVFRQVEQRWETSRITRTLEPERVTSTSVIGKVPSPASRFGSLSISAAT